MYTLVTQDVFDYLLKHLLDIHEQKMNLLSCFSIEYDAYMKMLSMINTYIQRIERFLGSAQIKDGENFLPFVIFGCRIVLSSLENQNTLLCRIVLPNDPNYEKKSFKDMLLFKCCSQTAELLLYKTMGDIVTLNIEEKPQRWLIRRIEATI